MNTKKEVEQIVRHWLEDRVADPQRRGLGEALKKVEATTQAKHRFLWRWFDRDGGARWFAITATGLIAVVATVAIASNLGLSPSQDIAPAAVVGRVHVVALDGSGDFYSIANAVEAATDGDMVMVKPGTYTEAILIGKDITLIGDGPRDAIIVEAPEGGPMYDTRSTFIEDAQYAVLLQGSAATVSGITFRGENARVIVDGGAPLLKDLAFDAVSKPSTGAERSFVGSSEVGALVINGGSTATIRGSSFTEGGNLKVLEHSNTLIENNTFSGGPGIAGDFGDGSIVRDNTMSGTFDSAIVLGQPTTMLIEGNTISGAGANAIEVGWGGQSPGVDPIIRGNTVIGSVGTGINLAADTNPTIEDNVIVGNRLGISVFRTDPVIARNELTDNVTGIMVTVGAPTLEGNTIDGGTVGLLLAGNGTNATLLGNTICGNETNLRVGDGIESPDDSANDICVDSLAD